MKQATIRSVQRAGAVTGGRLVGPRPAAGRIGLDRPQLLEVEVNDHLQRLASDPLAQGFWETVEPGGYWACNATSFNDGGTPALRPVRQVADKTGGAGGRCAAARRAR